MDCPTKTDLLSRYSAAARKYSRGVSNLHSITSVTSQEDSRRVRAATDDSRRLCDEAQAAWELHLAQHGC